MKSLICVSFCVFLVWGTAMAGEWSRFRGPNGTGISTARNIPARWTSDDFAWKVELPGVGHSSPVLYGDRIFLTSSDVDRGGITLMGVNAADGAVLWSQAFPFAPFRKHRFNSYASSTPVADRDHVYVTWVTPDRYMVVAFSHGGKKVWERDLGPFASAHGLGASPILHEGKVIVPNDQNQESFLIALDAKTGRTVWKTPRKGSEMTAYSTPALYAPEGGDPVLVFNSFAHGISGVDPGTGKVVWEYPNAFDKRSCSSPVAGDGVVIGSCGSGGGGNFVTAIRPPSEPGGKPELAWQLRRSAPYVPTGIFLEGHFYFFGDGGIASCIEAKTGEVLWQERVGRRFFSSPVLVDGRLYCMATDGEVVVLKAAAKFEEVARFRMDEEVHATPAVAHGRLYIRTFKHLIAVGGARVGG